MEDGTEPSEEAKSKWKKHGGRKTVPGQKYHILEKEPSPELRAVYEKTKTIWDKSEKRCPHCKQIGNFELRIMCAKKAEAIEKVEKIHAQNKEADNERHNAKYDDHYRLGGRSAQEEVYVGA